MAQSSQRENDKFSPRYIAIDAKTILLTNSPNQLERIKTAVANKNSLSALDEYRYFRTRYKIGEDDETAYIFLSDATIRRWCSPKWRIGQGRRLLQQDLMAQLTVRELAQPKRGNFAVNPISPFGDEKTLSPEVRTEYVYAENKGVMSNPIYGSFAYLTPIADLRGLDKVSEAEQRAYEQWRDRFEGTWRGVFDPIGIRLSLSANMVKTDVTVMPLNTVSLRELSRNFFWGVTPDGAFAPTAARYDVPMQFITALNTKSEDFQKTQKRHEEEDGVSLLWLGDYSSVYFDEDPFWDLLIKHLEKHGYDDFLNTWIFLFSDTFLQFEGDWTIPVVFEVDSKDKAKLDKCIDKSLEFVGDGWFDRTVQHLKHGDATYIAVLPKRPKEERVFLDKIPLYIAATENRLLVSLNEDSLKRAMDRKPVKESKWLEAGQAFRLDSRAVRVIDVLLKREQERAVQRGIARNRELLDWYKSRFPEADAIELHQRLFGEQLYKPEEMVRPSPLVDLQSAEFGITLENGGLRAKTEVRWK
jgi:hypothetical protein